MKNLKVVGLVAALLLAIPGTAMADEAEILKAHFKAVGGLEILSDIKTVKRTGNAKMGGVLGDMAGSIKQTILVGKKSHSETDFGVYRESTGWNGTTGWKSTSTEGTRTLARADLDTPRSAVFLDPLQNIYEQYGRMAFRQGKDGTIRGVDCVALEVVNTRVIFYIDRESNHVMATKLSGVGEGQVDIYYSDYAEYGGVVLPNSIYIDLFDGTITLEANFSKTEIDVEVDERLFEKP